jgi:hypothetical protein
MFLNDRDFCQDLVLGYIRMTRRRSYIRKSFCRSSFLRDLLRRVESEVPSLMTKTSGCEGVFIDLENDRGSQE